MSDAYVEIRLTEEGVRRFSEARKKGSLHEDVPVSDVYRIVARLLIEEAVKLDDNPVYLSPGKDQLTARMRVDP